MVKKGIKIVTVLSMLFVLVFSSKFSETSAAADPLLEVSSVRSLGDTVTVPVILRHTSYLRHFQFTITLPSDSKGVSLKSFETGDLFDGEIFRPKVQINGNKLTLDFISQSGAAERLRDYNANEMVEIGYITYDLTEEFTPGQSVPLEVKNVVAKEKDDEDLTIKILNGVIEHRMTVGDVIGNDGVTTTDAMWVLQHIGKNDISDREQWLAADVDADGLLTQDDAQKILDYATGKINTFLAIAAQELTNGVLQSEYSAKIEARHGRAPYEFDKSGRLPSGLELNEETGEITGVPRKAGEYTFTIEVIDAVGNEAERTYTLNIIDSNIISVEKIAPINVKLGETPVLPSKVRVTYSDKTTGMEKVTWEPVDTSTLGTVTARGKVGDSGFTVNATVQVVTKNYIHNINVGYFEMLNVHTIVVETTSDVYAMTVNDIQAHYEGNNQYSLASSTFEEGTAVTIKLFDKYGNVLETKVQTLTINE
ncbi:putative Ig domain-containing protein [Bacillus dakarensis]|uniref:putative Ig domain-containing protein n=1 Tax=Robertmurraya dakarensis TaxID=1926278 RepID=UPI000980DF10|nr:putative Ig domain-containing protein [Bacillus dakarensis]